MSHQKDKCCEFDYCQTIEDTCPVCLILFILNNYYKPNVYSFDYRYSKYSGHDIVCVIVKGNNYFGRLIIYQQHKQWYYMRFDYIDGYWIDMMCMFLDLRDCVDIFHYQKDTNRFIRSVWDCTNTWRIPNIKKIN